MLFSLEWILELCPFEGDTAELARLLTARGLTVDAFEGSGDDTVLDIDVPANRPDCLGHLGVARELSAASDVALARRPPLPAGQGSSVERSMRLDVAEPELCARFSASIVRGVSIGPSPPWVVKRLEACGLRSISNVVDASNLVLLESGNPVHFYDLSLLRGGVIGARLAAKNERIKTLDGIERRLEPDMLVIADGERSVGVAGVMGGADAEINPETTDVLVEAAWFRPGSIRSTSQRLGLHTDASFRFVRGVDAGALPDVQTMALRLLTELAGGRPDSGMLDSRAEPVSPAVLRLRLGQLGRLLGYQPDPGQVVEALAAVGLAPEQDGEDRLSVTVPSWRIDVEREADLVEEVARHLGYDRIPGRQTEMHVPHHVPGAAERLEEQVRDVLSHGGFNEALGYAMIGRGEDDAFVPDDAADPLVLANPIAESMGQLRRSLLPGLLKATDLNLRRGVRDARLFEVGRVFFRAEDGGFPRELLHVGLAWTGSARSPHWSLEDADAGLLDIAGVVESLIEALRPELQLRRESCELRAFHPGRSMRWTADENQHVGRCGALHPSLQRELAQPVLLAEVELDLLAGHPALVPQYRALPRLGLVSRDLSLVLTSAVRYADVVQTLESVDAPAAATFHAIDRYEGPPLAGGEASLTVRVSLQPEGRSLTEERIEGYRVALIEALQRELGLTIR